MTNVRAVDAKRFFRIYYQLLGYTNRCLELVDGVKEGPDIDDVSVSELLTIRDGLYDHDGLIQGFVWNADDDLDQPDRKLAASWRSYEYSEFLVRQYTRGYAEFIDIWGPHRLYAVKSLRQSFKQMGLEPPEVVSAVLLPYEGRIVADGVVEPESPIGGMAVGEYEEEVEIALDRYGVIEELPAPREPTQADYRYPDGDRPDPVRQELDDHYRAAMRGDPQRAYQLIAVYEQAVRKGAVDPDMGGDRFERYHYDRVTTGIDTVALTEGWPFLSDLIEAYDPREDDEASPVTGVVVNAVARFIIRTRLTGSIADIPDLAVESLGSAADASPETETWRESTAIGWAVGHAAVNVADLVATAVTNGRGEWAANTLRHVFYADQIAAVAIVDRLATEGTLEAMPVDFIPDLEDATAWPPGPTGRWWEEFAYSFAWDPDVRQRVRTRTGDQ